MFKYNNSFQQLLHKRYSSSTYHFILMKILMAKCKTAVTPLLSHWSYCSLALSHSVTHPIGSRHGKYWKCTLIARFMGPKWGPAGANRTQVGPTFTGGNRAKLPSSRWRRRGRSLRQVFACSRLFGTTDHSQICNRVTRGHVTPCTKTTDSYPFSFLYNNLRKIRRETTVGEKPGRR